MRRQIWWQLPALLFAAVAAAAQDQAPTTPDEAKQATASFDQRALKLPGFIAA
jgi:hypothetical protein